MGYINYSMSERAYHAYNQGEKPLSKFRKEDRDLFCELVEKGLNLNVKFKNMEQFKDFVYYHCESSWHHTSKFFNQTYFYDVVYFLTDREYYTDDLDLQYEEILQAIKENESHIKYCLKGYVV